MIDQCFTIKKREKEREIGRDEEKIKTSHNFGEKLRFHLNIRRR